MYVNLQKMHANYILDFVLFINNAKIQAIELRMFFI